MFTQETFAPIGAQSTEAPTAWSYRTSDLIEDVKAAGYFNSKRFSLEVGDTIWVDAGDSSALLKYQGNDESIYVVAPRPVQEVLFTFDTGDQIPTALDTPVQVYFGAATSNIYVTLDAYGTVTIHEEGVYNFLGQFNVSRDTNNGESYHVKWLEANGVQVGNTLGAIIINTRIALTQQFEFTGFFPAGTVLKLYQARDSQGVNDGGLYTATPTLPINVSPSASLRINKLS